MNPRRVRLPAPESMALQLGAGRAVMAAGFLAAPIPSARLLGLDTATAQRVGWLTRMMAVRDGAIGVGGLVAGRRNPSTAAPWLLAGAVSDAVDAVVLAGAIRRGRVRGVVPTAVVPLAAGAAIVGALSALRLRRR